MSSPNKFSENFPFQIILASASPRRKELLSGLGFNFTIQPLQVDEENWPENLKGPEICLYLAKKKSDACKDLKENEILITADTIVWCQNKIYNKPNDFEEAKKMLSELSGKMHEVFTSVCLKSKDKQISFFDSSKVYFKNLSDCEIEYYITNFKPYDKAGSYGVQDWLGYTGIEKIEGSFYNVMGLPVKKLYEELLNF